jgi:hypothetical protein
VIVHLLDFLVESSERRICGRTFTQEHDARHHVLVIDDLSVFAVDGTGELAEPDFRPLRTQSAGLRPDHYLQRGRCL